MARQTVSHQDMANAIRALAMDAVQRANSGHPGMPMGMADVATVLFTKHLKYDPGHPEWPDRDRFVLSAGHGSMLLYSLLYLTGYRDMTVDEIRNFRQLGSKTPGHPEYWEAPGIETTTGPLGQGIGNAVGMALAEAIMRDRFGPEMVDHWTYVVAGDGCLMEGISQEAISLAGHLGLGKLILLYDDNHISIDGDTSLAISDDAVARFAASGWDAQAVDGHDPRAVDKAIRHARETDAPSMIACRTVIGFGAPNKEGSESTHGSPLGEEEVAAAREKLGWSYPPFEVPEDILRAWREAGMRGDAAYAAWQDRLGAAEPGVQAEFQRRIEGELSGDVAAAVREFKRRAAEEQPNEATRKSSGAVIEALVPAVPELIGGSADLTGSNNTKAKSQSVIAPGSFSGSYLHYGVREHAMGAAMNGLALHGGVIPYGGSFLVFTDYCRPALRLSALIGKRVIYVMTHDSIGLGEDGPTHQPVEHLASLRAMPNVNVFRPADAAETAEAWMLALAETGRPSVLVLTRQGVPYVSGAYTDENRVARGAYVLAEADGERQVTLLATGSEVSIALDARKRLAEAGIAAAVVSMPCWELFDQQPQSYRDAVLGRGTVRVAVEAAAGLGWERYLGPDGGFVGMSGFGASAPGDKLYDHFGITADDVVAEVKGRL